MTTESTTITETAADGTETTVEITTTKSDESSLIGDDGQSLVEEVIEAIFDGSDDFDATEAGNEQFVTTEYSAFPESDLDAAYESAAPTGEVSVIDDSGATDVFGGNSLGFAGGGSDVSADAASVITDENSGNESDPNNIHSDAAADAQKAADEFVEAGDYAAAADARQTAEDEASQAGDNSVLQGSDAGELQNAADKQENAEYYELRQAEHAEAGDYEAAKEDAINAGYATGDADYLAGGADHTGQADNEAYRMDNAVWEEGIAEDYAEAAEFHAEMGNEDAAQEAADNASEHQEAADHQADLGTHGGEYAETDSSSQVDSGGNYDASYDAVDTSTYDTTVDTTTYDTTTDYSSSYDTTTDYSSE
jgi:hypothetical protein